MNTPPVAFAHASRPVSRVRRTVTAICVPFFGRDQLILIRGLPGSGKSTKARGLAIAGFAHFEDDMFYERDGVYEYDASRIKDAHAWCQKMTREALADGKRVVVSNTFTRLQEMEPYRSMAKHIRVVEAKGNWRSIHGVPADVVQRTKERWEALPTTGRDLLGCALVAQDDSQAATVRTASRCTSAPEGLLFLPHAEEPLG